MSENKAIRSSGVFEKIEGELDLGPKDWQVPEGSEGGWCSREQAQLARAQRGPEGDGRAGGSVGQESHFFTPSCLPESFLHPSYVFTVITDQFRVAG